MSASDFTPAPGMPAAHAGGARPHSWGAEALWESLEPLLPGLSIEVVERLDSTNSELAERLRRAERDAAQREGREGRDRRDLGRDAGTGDAREGRGRSDDLQPQLLVATHQTSGRGRLGRRWHAAPGASLTFSLALRLERTDWSGLSLAVGLAVVEALDPSGERLGLKWPNDLMLREAGGIGRKLGGILIESVVIGAQRVAIVGIGINVQPQPLAESDIGIASLSELDPGITARDALARLGPALARALVAFQQDGFAPCIEAYARRDVLSGRAVTTTDPAMPAGIAAGVAPDGALKLVAGDTTHRVISGEVSVRPAATPR